MNETTHVLISFIVAAAIFLAFWYTIQQIAKAHKTGRFSGRYGRIYDRKQMPVFFWLALLGNYVFVALILGFSIFFCGSLILDHFHISF